MSKNVVEQLTRAQSLLNDLFGAQQYLISAQHLTRAEWDLVSVYLQPKDYFEVVEERNCQHRCGFCFCDTPTLTIEEYHIQKLAKINKQKPKFERTWLDPVVDVPDEIFQYSYAIDDFVNIKDQLFYCSKACYVESKLLAENLDSLPLNLRKLPFSNFIECTQAISRLNENVQMGEQEENIWPSFEERNKKKQLNRIKQDLESINAIENEVTIKENVKTKEPSKEFEVKDEKTLQPMDIKKMPKMQLSLFTEVYIFLRDSISVKTKRYLKKLDEEKKTKPNEEFSSYSIPPLSSSFKRYETLEKAIGKE